MASIENVDFISVNSTPVITFIQNRLAFSSNVAGWTGTGGQTKYKFRITFTTPTTGSNLFVWVSVNDGSDTRITATYVNTIGVTWYGTFTYDGIVCTLALPVNTSYTDYEEFYVSKISTIEDGNFKWGTSKVHKCIFIDGAGSRTVYQEQVKTPLFGGVASYDTSITWYYKNNDPDVNVDLYARIGTSAFALKSSNCAYGVNKALNFTGLSPGTSYNIDVYAKQNGTLVKINSEEATYTKSTLSPPSWEYVLTQSSGSTETVNDEYLGSTIAQALSYLEGNFPSANYGYGDTALIESDQDVYYLFEID